MSKASDHRSRWRPALLKDLVFFQRGFDITKAEQQTGTVPVVSSSGINSYHSTAKTDGPGVVIGRKGSLGTVHYIDCPYWPHDTTLWSKDFKGNYPKFVYYFVHTLGLERYDVGNSNPTLNRNHIHQLEIDIPDWHIQQRIASILSAYDDLIENNRRRIQLLEESARLLYREWFVHLRFPGHEHVKIVDGLPEGWEKKTLGDFLEELESGGRPKGGALDAGVPSIGAENILGIGRYDFQKEKYVPDEYFKKMQRGVVKNRDVLIYKDGANIGRASHVGEGFPHEQCCVNEHVFILRAIKEVGQSYLYFWAEQDETRQRVSNLNSNTAQPGVSQEKLKTLEFVRPSRIVAETFNDNVEPLIKQIFTLAKKNRVLEKARNLLLPKLMNGEILS